MAARELSVVRSKKEYLGRLCVSIQSLLVERNQEEGETILPELGLIGGWETCTTDTLHLLLRCSSCHGKVCFI